MKIVHIHLLGPYTDGWGYQENVLPEIQVRQGHEVAVITGCETHCPDNSIIKVDPCEYFINGVKIIRINYKQVFRNEKINRIWFYYPVKEYLEQINPDIILLHGLGEGRTNIEIKKHVRAHPECLLFGDVHTFAGNSDKALTIKNKIVNFYKQFCRKKLFPYYQSVFCITTQCMDYAKNIYKVPEHKLQLFPLGYDPASIDWEHREDIREAFRREHGIDDSEIVVVHGGKIIPRRKTEVAVEAVCRLNTKVRLVVFGKIDDSIKDSIMQQFEKCDDMIYLGHLTRSEYIKVFLASDIALFPGGQSSLWEEAIGCGLPMLVNKTEDKDAPYFDRGGNIVFTKEDSVDEFVNELNMMIDSKKYIDMAQVAETLGREFFSYERISEIMTGKEFAYGTKK